jgi:peptidylprolyl isomerase
MRGFIPIAALLLAAPALAQDKPAHEPSPGEVVAAAPKADWIAIAPEDLLVMDLAPDAGGAKREVVIQLMPPPFSQGWVDNIRTLAKAHWWDGTSVYRVQDDYVAQWGGGDDKDEPKGLKVVPESEYQAAITVLPDHPPMLPPDPYAYNNSFMSGFPVSGTGAGRTDYWWPIHCYGMVGVARGTDNTGSGAELYTVIGQAPRQLDRNIALAGRVIEGMENLSSLPRGHGEIGFYSDAEKGRRTPIVSVRLASDLPEAERPKFEYLSTESASFAAYVHARANRHDEFFKVPAGGVDVCNVPVPIRRVEPAK